MLAAKEKMSDTVASAKAGMEKTKATFQEKAERMTNRDPEEKDMAMRKKEERMYDAEMNKRDAHDQNAAAAQRHAACMGGRDFANTADTTDYGTPPAYNDSIITNIVGEQTILSDRPT